MIYAFFPQQFLYFLPEPHGQQPSVLFVLSVLIVLIVFKHILCRILIILIVLFVFIVLIKSYFSLTNRWHCQQHYLHFYYIDIVKISQRCKMLFYTYSKNCNFCSTTCLQYQNLVNILITCNLASTFIINIR